MEFVYKEKLTHIIIFIFILLSLTYLYNMNSNIKTKTKTKTENFMILTEDQILEANDVLIDNITQVIFKAGGDNNSTIKFPNPEREWPVTLQDLFDTKLDNNGIIGGPVPFGHTPLQGIILNSTDVEPKPLVKLGANLDWAVPTSATLINDNFIQFGGFNKDRQIESARISVNSTLKYSDEGTDSLCIVGMSNLSGTIASRKIKMWAEGGLTLVNATPLNITGKLDVTGVSKLSSTLEVTGTTALKNTLNVTLATTLNGGLTVTGGATINGLTTLNNGATIHNGATINAGATVNGLATLNNGLTFSGPTYGGMVITQGDIRKSSTAENKDLHLVTNQNLYLMAKDNVIIYKNPVSNEWLNPSGNLVVQNSLTVSVGSTLSGGATINGLATLNNGATINNGGTINGGLTVDVYQQFNLLPKGSIIMWGWKNVAPPAGWVICNGQTVEGIGATPNLTGSIYPLGVSVDSIGNSGGSASKSFTLGKEHMPSHNHGPKEASPPFITFLTENTSGPLELTNAVRDQSPVWWGGGLVCDGGCWNHSLPRSVSFNHEHSYEGSGQAYTMHDMWLPYCGVTFIMRVA